MVYDSLFRKYHQKQMLRNGRLAAGLDGGRTSRTMEILPGPVGLTFSHPPALALLNIAKRLIFCFGKSFE